MTATQLKETETEALAILAILAILARLARLASLQGRAVTNQRAGGTRRERRGRT
jgi:hypothetical protein